MVEHQLIGRTQMDSNNIPLFRGKLWNQLCPVTTVKNPSTKIKELGMVVCVCNPSTWEAGLGGLQI
jgi:hypothetical protein